MFRSVGSKLIRMPYAGLIFRHMEKAYRKRKYSRDILKGTPIIVYQMGKVGSASIKNSLESCGIEPVFHVHKMNPSSIQRVRHKALVMNLTPWAWWLGERLFSDIIQKGKKAKFITLVREPISRSISTFFQNFVKFTGVEYDDANFTVEELVRIFMEKSAHAIPLGWFDKEMKSVLGIDVYQYPFPKGKGYLTIKHGNFELLIVKLEVDDSVKEKAISDFLGIEDFRLTKSNVAQDKIYARTYADFIKTLQLPESYVRIMCNSEYMRHFYSDTEIESIRSKWQNKVGNAELSPAIHKELLRAASRDFD